MLGAERMMDRFGREIEKITPEIAKKLDRIVTECYITG